VGDSTACFNRLLIFISIGRAGIALIFTQYNMFTPAFYRHLASVPIPTDLASSPSVLSYPSLRLFLKLIADIDLRRPRAISPMGMARRYGCSMADVARALQQLVTNDLLERCCDVRADGRNLLETIKTGVYVIPYKWWLSADDIAQEVDAGAEIRGRGELVEDSPLTTHTGTDRQIETEEVTSSEPEPEPIASETPGPSSLFLSLLGQALVEGERKEEPEAPPSPASRAPASNRP
jgi:hypothetical protein